MPNTLDMVYKSRPKQGSNEPVLRASSLQNIPIPRLKLDGRKRSKTTDTTANGHIVMPSHEQLSVQISDAAANVGRSPSFTGDSSDQFVVVDNISIDDSVSTLLIIASVFS